MGYILATYCAILTLSAFFAAVLLAAYEYDMYQNRKHNRKG